MRVFSLVFWLVAISLSPCHAEVAASSSDASLANAGTPSAANNGEKDVALLTEFTPNQFQQLLGRLGKEIPKILSKTKRQQAESDLASLTNKVDGLADWSTFSSDERIELANRYESLRGQVSTARERNRQMRCKSTKRLGSNMIVQECKSKDELELESLRAADALQQIQSKSLQGFPIN